MHSIWQSPGGKYAGIYFFDIEVFFIKNFKIAFFTDSTFLVDHLGIIVYYARMKKTDKKILSLKLRENILRLAARTNSAYPHIGSCFSCIDILIETHIYQMKKDDKFILSKGHASLALYVVLNHLGKLSDRQINTYFTEGGLGIHPPTFYPEFIPLATGSLGHGLSFAAGVAKGYKLEKMNNRRVFCLLSDGECNEGSVWEAALFASQHKLKNLIVIIDKNGFQGIDATVNVLGEAASKDKWKAFGFNIVTCDGHDFRELNAAFKKIAGIKNNLPNVLIANTKRAKGIKAIEGMMISNYFALNNENLESIIKELKGL